MEDILPGDFHVYADPGVLYDRAGRSSAGILSDAVAEYFKAGHGKHPLSESNRRASWKISENEKPECR